MSRVIAGLGFRRGCPAADILAVVRDAAAKTVRPVDALAVPDFKADEPALQEAAQMLGLPLIRVAHAALQGAQGRCLTRSDIAQHATGFASVAEGCALAAAGDGGRLLLPRIAGPRATCALAEAFPS